MGLGNVAVSRRPSAPLGALSAIGTEAEKETVVAAVENWGPPPAPPAPLAPRSSAGPLIPATDARWPLSISPRRRRRLSEVRIASMVPPPEVNAARGKKR